MQIKSINSISFQRKLLSREERDYSNVLKEAKNKLGNNGKSILIVPYSSLPNKTGVGNFANTEGEEFVKFTKKYWDINEVQLLPIGQYHFHGEDVPFYSGTSMDLGNHVINIEDFISKEEFEQITKSNNIKNKVNFKNVIEKNSAQEIALQNLYKNIDTNMKTEFELYKKNNSNLLEPKALYQALKEINNSYDYKKWNDLDRNLFNPNMVKEPEKEKRIKEIYSLKSKEIDFYKFKQFLAEKSLAKAKENLNSKGIKLSGDMPCGFSYDEIWANPKAFIKDATIGWELPALDLDSREGKELLKKKVNLYAQRFDGFRVDAAWTYISEPITKNGVKNPKYYGEEILNLIEDEVKKVKGNNYNLKNISYEFTASPNDFNIFDGEKLKPFIEKRMKIFTSDYMDIDWGTNDNFLKRGWNKENFILGASNHDSCKYSLHKNYIKTLSKILKIPEEKLNIANELRRSRLAEAYSAYNNMLFFIDGLGLEDNRYKQGSLESYKTLIPDNFEDEYIKALEKREGFNPMDALEQNFRAKGLDKSEKELYKKIVKYRDILENKPSLKTPYKTISIILGSFGILAYGMYAYLTKQKSSKNIEP